MAQINPVQFSEVLKNTLQQGGDSVNIVTGRRPDRGYMVSDENSETRVRAENLSVDKISRHVEKHSAVLRNEPEAHLGTWRDARYSAEGKMVPSPTDQTYLDVSRRYHSPLRAYTAAQKNNQLAMYDVANEAVIETPQDLTRTHRARRRSEPHVERFM